MMVADELGLYMLIAIMAMAISMALIPILIKLAPSIGMLDSPGDRKVHSEVIPRIGGIGIVIGLIIPVFIWLPIDNFIGSFLFGCAILLVFGAWDDARELGPYVKFSGQFIASLSVVYIGNIYVSHFPFLGLTELPEIIGKPFTVIAIMGMINAINLSDGLDGLAGGEALISLAAITYLSILYEGQVAAIIATATIGGIFGFLRFNSHPAKVFMGDSGSQTLGFILGVLVVYLSQNVNPVISPVVPLFLLGLPVVDALVVFYMRAKRGESLVVAAKDHMHHRLLGLGFYHYESVMIIYSMHILLVILAVMLPYESDALLIITYMLICGSVFSMVAIAERKRFSVHTGRMGRGSVVLECLRGNGVLLKFPIAALRTGLSIVLVASALMTYVVPMDIGISSGMLLLLLMAVMISGFQQVIVYRLVMYCTIGFAVYLLAIYPPQWLLEDLLIVYLFFIFISTMGFLAAKIKIVNHFQITPLDYLVITFAIAISFAPDVSVGSSTILLIAIQIIILFYAAELHIQSMKNILNSVTGVLSATLLLFTMRAFF